MTQIAWQGSHSRYGRSAQDSTNMYFVPGMARGRKSYKYVLVQASRHRDFLAQLKTGALPDYAVIVAEGLGEPNDATRRKMKFFYGFEH